MYLYQFCVISVYRNECTVSIFTEYASYRLASPAKKKLAGLNPT